MQPDDRGGSAEHCYLGHCLGKAPEQVMHNNKQRYACLPQIRKEGNQFGQPPRPSRSDPERNANRNVSASLVSASIGSRAAGET